MLSLRWCSVSDDIAVIEPGTCSALIGKLTACIVKLLQKLGILVQYISLVVAEARDFIGKRVGTLFFVLEVHSELAQVPADFLEIHGHPSCTSSVSFMPLPAILVGMAASTVMFGVEFFAEIASHERAVVWLLAFSTYIARRLIVVDKVETA